MELYYIISIDEKEYTGSAVQKESRSRGKLCCSTYEAPLSEDVSAVIHEEKDDALHTSKCWLEIQNGSKKPVKVSKVSIGFRTTPCRGILHYFSSSWGKEFVPHDIPIPEQFGIGTLKGRSSEEYSPWIGLESESGCFCMSLAWSGNWNCDLKNSHNVFTLVMGIHNQGFFTDLGPGKSFAGAPVYLSFSDSNLDEASRRLRRYFIENGSVVRAGELAALPVVYNTWWSYEDRFINEEVCIENARHAANLGMTNFVLDAGWFGMPEETVNWYGKRGDWDVENISDFPSGLARLGEAVAESGIMFGIWCEIEGIGTIAKLHQTMPQMVARRDGASLGYLCMANPETRSWAMKVIDKLVTRYRALWIKFDFNVSPGLGCNSTGHGHGEGDGLYWHYMGYYRFLQEVHEKYPRLVIENCGSGGMRTDLGILSHAHYAYMSDHDYADNHFQCLWGAASFIHPALCYQFTQSECISDHNGIFNPITEDISPAKLDFYIRATLLSTCGFAYRFKNWKPEWLERLKYYIGFFKSFSKKYILEGEMYRLTGQALRGGKGDRWQAYQYKAEDGSSYVFVFRLKGGEPQRAIYLQGLEEKRMYDILFEDCEYRITRSGKSFMEEGICFSSLPEEGSEIMKVKPAL